jgi:hypothetical protein
MKTQDLPEYNLREAAEFMHSTISQDLRDKYTVNNIYQVLEIMDDYFDITGLNVYEDTVITEPELPVEMVDMDEVSDFIIQRIARYGLNISNREMEEILDAELIYCQNIGICTIDETNK